MEKALGNQRVLKGGETWSAKTDAEISLHVREWFTQFRHALPPSEMASAPKIVDIGCGLGMYHAYLHQFYGGRSEHFLVDRSVYQIGVKGYEQHTKRGGYHKSIGLMPFYTSDTCAREIAMANGFTERDWHWVNATADNVRALEPVDIVMSMLSWGFHYPIDVYIEAVHHILKPDGRLIVTLRVGQGQEAVLQRAGFSCSNSDPTQKHYLIVCRKRAATAAAVLALPAAAGSTISR